MYQMVRMEMDRHDWHSVECGCGKSADHFLGVLREGVGGSFSAIRSLEGHVFIQSNLMPPAPAVTSVAMAALGGPDTLGGREDLVWLILSIASGEEDGDSVESSIYWKCHELIRDGLWVIYREAISGGSEVKARNALDVAEIVEWDEDRLDGYRRAIREIHGRVS
ncbi:hypothetical protein ACFXKG_11025 [Streptomyces sp. NPDC059255]|uniref:hypothetical protein n=1 Tax=Streptomyces sp. NPDC059255 TaxID=3346793 RepID=UPI0036760D8D